MTTVYYIACDQVRKGKVIRVENADGGPWDGEGDRFYRVVRDSNGYAQSSILNPGETYETRREAELVLAGSLRFRAGIFLARAERLEEGAQP